MENKYDLGNRFQLVSASKNATMRIGFYEQSCSLAVFMKNSNSNRPVVRVPMNMNIRQVFIRLLKKAIASNTEVNSSFTQLEYDKATKKSNAVANLEFFRDNEQRIGIAVSSKNLTTPEVFFLKSSNTFNVNGNPLTAAESSNIAAETFVRIIDSLVFGDMLSTFNREKQQRNFNRSGGNRGGSDAPASGSSGSENGGDDPFGDSAF